MKGSRKFALWLGVFYGAVLALVAGVAALLAAGLPEGDQRELFRILEDRAPLLAFVAFILFFAAAGVLAWFFRNYVTAARALAEQARIVAAVNPEHRVAVRGGPEVAELATAVNRLGDAMRNARLDLEVETAESNARVEEERNRLAALMSELSEGVLVCNAEGRILLYNEQARALLGAAVGLGRSVFAVLDRERVAHALDKIQRNLERDAAYPVTTLLTTAAGGALVKIRLAPFRSAESPLAGMVLTLNDITAAHLQDARRRSLLESLATRLRSPAANIRAAAENLQDFPEMNAADRERFASIIVQESTSLSAALDEALRDHAEALQAGLTLEDMPLADLLVVVGQRIDAIVGSPTTVEPLAEPIWVKVDSFAWVQALAALASRLQAEHGVRQFGLRAARHASFAQVDLTWRGALEAGAALDAWEREPLLAGSSGSAFTLREVLDRHGGEVWREAESRSDQSWLRFLLPLGQPVATLPRQQRAVDSRPEYYDFDLFHQASRTPGLASRRLLDLDYTVFDTETTGLEPSAGDKIISIGAVRIVNGRLLKNEVYEQLVNPERSVPKDSVRIHGIQPDDLAGQPAIGEALPAFHRFCEDTVLVAHNAAFDMRFLELSEAATGIRFTHPVLDTLLLSAVVHPHQDDHRLEAIAERLGVQVIGRHTAVGDALVTAEVFLKLVPLLAERGIHTLGEALDASRETYYVRLQY